MKKVGVVAGIIFTLLAAVYVLLFTSAGNRLLSPIIAKKINRATDLTTSLKKFELRPGRFAVILFLTPENRIEAEGEYSLFSRSVKAEYRVLLNDLAGLKALTKTELFGTFQTSGTVTGTLDNLLVSGASDVAAGTTTYSVTLTDFNPSVIKAKIVDAKVAQLLEMVGKKPFSTANLTLDMVLKSIDPKSLDGDVVLAVTNGKVDTALMKTQFDLTLPETSYSLNATSHLQGTQIRYTVNLDSNLAHLLSAGTVSPEPLQADLTYELDAKELALFKPLTNAPLRGPLTTSGTVKGDRLKMAVNGISDIGASETSYDITLEDLKPRQVLAKINHGQLDKLLYLAGQPMSATGRLDVDLTLTDLDPENLKGQAAIKISKGELTPAVFKKEYDITLPPTSFSYDLNAKLQGKSIAFTTGLESNLAKIGSEGSFIPKAMGVDLKYNVDVAKLELLKPLTNSALRGPIKTAGTVKGDQVKMTVTGTSDIAASQTTYDVSLEDMKARKVLAKISNGDLAKLLYLAGQPALATGRLDVDLTLTDLDPENLKGQAEIKISKGEMVSAVFKKEYDIVLPQATFTYGLNATLKGTAIDYRTLFDSTLAKIGSDGSFIPKTMGMDLKYHVDIAKLELLQPFTGTPLRGAMKLAGTARGDQKFLTVEGASDLAGSDTTFKAGLADFKPATITAKIKNLQLARALAMVAKPHYGDGVVNVDVNIANAKAGELKGSVTTEISQGKLDTKVMAAEFEFTDMPETTFSVKTQSTLAGKLIDTAATVNSSLLTLKTSRSRYDLDQSLLTSDYQADIPDLDKLFFIAGRHLKGAMILTGELKKGEHLDLAVHTDTMGGRIDVTVHDDDVHADLKKIQTLETLKMLIYPEVLDSSLDGGLDYNLKVKKGVFDANLIDGKFTRNVMLDLLLNLAKTDLYKERFNGTLHSQINQELITSDLDLKSRTSSIIAKKATLNSKTKQIDAKLDVLANNNPIGVSLKGNVDKPVVKLDTSALIKKEASKALEKEVDKLLKNLFK